MTTELRFAPDWWGRWMAFGSLLVAGAALAYSYMRQSELPDSDALLAAVHTKTAEFDRLEAAARQQRTEKNDQLITDIRTRADALLTRNQQLMTELTLLKVQLANNAAGVTREAADAMATSEPSGGDSVADDDQVADAATRVGDETESTPDEQDAPEPDGDAADTEGALVLDLPGNAPDPAIGDSTGDRPAAATWAQTSRLRLVQQTRRPADSDDPAQLGDRVPPLRIATDDDPEPVKVLSVSFYPDQVVDLSEPISQSTLLEDESDSWFMMFEPGDNLTSTADHHGMYQRDLETPFYLRPKEERNLRVVIVNERHAGFALSGQLTIQTETGKPLEVNGAEVMFVVPPRND